MNENELFTNLICPSYAKKKKKKKKVNNKKINAMQPIFSINEQKIKVGIIHNYFPRNTFFPRRLSS